MGRRFFAAFISACVATLVEALMRVMPGLIYKGDAFHFIVRDNPGAAIDAYAMTWLTLFGLMVVVGIPGSYVLRAFRINGLAGYMIVLFLALAVFLTLPVGGRLGVAVIGRRPFVTELSLLIPFWYIVEGGPKR